MIKYWLDTEFIEDGKTIDLISIGIVAEDGRSFYAENIDCDLSKASPWVKDNVIPNLFSKSRDKRIGNDWILLSHKKIAREVVKFCDPIIYGKPEFWAYCCSYDWVVFCQLFGTMMDLPKGFPMYCNDIKQECDRLGNPRLPEQVGGEHIALNDAQWNRQAWEFLKSYELK